MSNKYGAVPKQVDGYKFASGAEARRYEELRLQALAGEITDMTVHPRFPLYAPYIGQFDVDMEDPRDELIFGSLLVRRIGYYTADFAYHRRGAAVVEDVKGGRATRTEAYRLRKRLVEATYGITITEVVMP